MGAEIIVTLAGPDRIGLVEEVAAAILEVGGNIGTSRMARLGGEFAVLMQVTLASEHPEAVRQALDHLASSGYHVSLVPARAAASAHEGWLPYQVTVSGADHEGIVHGIAAGLARSGITIETAETWTEQAPVSGAPLFYMRAEVLVPPEVDESAWVGALMDAAERAGVEAHASLKR